MRGKRRKAPERDTWITPGFASLLRDGSPSDLTFINAIRDGRLKGITILDAKGNEGYAVRWRDAKAFTARAYVRRGR